MHDADFLQAMALSHLKVIGVMGRGDLHAPGSKLLIHIRICHHRNLTARERQLKHLADQILIALILRIHRHRSVSQKSLRAGGGNLHIPPLLPHNGIMDMPEKAVLLLMLHLCI